MIKIDKKLFNLIVTANNYVKTFTFKKNRFLV